MIGRMVTLSLGLFVMVPRICWGQSRQTIEAARGEIERLEADSAVARLSGIVGEHQGQDRGHLTRAYTLMGIGYAMRGDLGQAQGAFHEALWVDPALRIDSLYHLSANLETLFSGVRGRWTARLRATSEPPGAVVLVSGRSIGLTPLDSPVPSTRPLVVEVRGSGGSRSVTVTIPENRIAIVDVAMPQDTLSWPVLPSEGELLDRFRLASKTQWHPSTLPPPRVHPPDSVNRPLVLAGIFLGLAASAVVAFKVTDNIDDPNARGWAAGGILFSGVLVGGGLGVLMDLPWKSRSVRRYEDYQLRLRLWQAQAEVERVHWMNERVRQEIAAKEPDRQWVMERNTAVRKRNAELPEPRVMILPIPR